MSTTFPDLSRLVTPRNVLVIGASQKPNSEGKRLLENLEIASLAGDVFVVHPSMKSVGRFHCCESFDELPPVAFDVALVMVRAAAVPDTLRACADRKVLFAIVMSSGFEEAGEQGKALAAEIAEICSTSSLRVYGPNCPGLNNYRDGIGMTFAPVVTGPRETGPVGLISQGGASGRTVLQGLSGGGTAVGVWLTGGNELDLNTSDYIAHFANDPRVKVIAVVVEGVKNGTRLTAALALAREKGKPVVVLKVGRSAFGVQAAQSHTGALAGAADVMTGVLKQFGAIEVDDIDELVAVTRLLAGARKPLSPNLAVVTFSGGAGAMAADHAGFVGLGMAKFQPETVEKLRARLPAFAAIGNPVDVTAEAFKDMDAMCDCLSIVASDPGVGTVVVPFPADYGSSTEVLAKAVQRESARTACPIVPVWSSRRLGAGFTLLEAEGLAPFHSMSKAMSALRKAFGAGAPSASPDLDDEVLGRSGAGAPAALIAHSEPIAKRFLRDFGIAVPEGSIAHDADEAAEIALHLGLPVVMKIVSADIAHKTEAGGVRLNLRSEQQVRYAHEEILRNAATLRPDARIDGVLVEKMFGSHGREMIVGVHADPSFGRVLTVGMGGVFVEMVKDVAHRVLPITRADAAEMLSELRNKDYLGAIRGKPAADIEAILNLLVAVSNLCTENPAIGEAELNPVWVGNAGEGVFALDALIFEKTEWRAPCPSPI